VLLEKLRRELWEIGMEKHQAELRAKNAYKAELARNLKLDRHSIRAFTRKQILFAEKLLGLN